MELRTLSYFVAVYEEGNISRAAKRCHVSQPSLSSSISSLESQLNNVLFKRHKKGVTPTEGADRLYLSARRLLNDAAAIHSMFKPMDEKPILTLGLISALDVQRVMKLIHPLLDNGQYELHLVRTGEPCDARITCQEDLKPDEAFLELWREDFVVAIPEGNPLSIKPDIVLGDLQQQPLITRQYCSTSLLEAARLAGITFNVVASAFSEEWAVALVDEGVGLAILPSNYIKPEHRIVARHFSNMSPQRTVGLAYPKEKGLPKVLRNLAKDF